MPKKSNRSGKHWNNQEIKAMRQLAKGNTPTGLIAHELGRSEAAVYAKASEEGISLKPVNQSPYNRRKRR